MKKVIIVGGGASSLACAITIKRSSDYEVVIKERLDSVGKKLKATGSGKGNIGNDKIDAKMYNHPLFAKEVIDSFSMKKLESFFESVGVLTKKDAEGRIYPFNESANAVLEALKLEAKKQGVQIETNKYVKNVSYTDGKFNVDEDSCDFLVLATGGKSSSNLGSDGSGYELAKMLGHKVTPLYPGLTGFYTKDELNNLDGIRCKVAVKLNDFNESGEILFRKKALSGIVIFNLTSYIQRNNITGKTCWLDFFKDYSLDSLVNLLIKYRDIQGWKYIDSFLNGVLDKYVFNYLLSKSAIDFKGRLASTLTDIEILNLARLLKNFPITLEEPYDFSSSQVTIGGVSLLEVNKHFESRLIKHLYLVGELLDIDGYCGGYNLYMAFASGIISGMDVVNCIQ